MQLLECPECQHNVSPRAVACPQCGFPIGSGTALLSQELVQAELVRSPLQEIAYRQKLLLYALLLYVVSQVPLTALTWSEWLAPLGWLGLLGNVALEAWCLYKLGRAMNMSVPVIVLLSLALFIPCVALIILLLVNQKATEALQRAGVRVGLMGARLDDVP